MADTRVIIAAAVYALQCMYRQGFNYGKAGVVLVELRPDGQQQRELDLFGICGEDVTPEGRAPSRWPARRTRPATANTRAGWSGGRPGTRLALK